jgi:hypothetical protein
MVERRTTKAGGREEGLAYLLRLESEFKKKERGFVPRRDFWSETVAIFSSGYYEAAETTQYPVGYTPQLLNSLRGKGCRTTGKREEKGRN